MADEGGVGVGVHALLPGHPRRGRGQVRGSIPPTPRVGRGRQGDGDVVAQQRHSVGLRGMRGGNDRWDVLVRVRHPLGPLVKARAVSMDRRGCVVQDLACGWELPSSIDIPLPRDVRTHKWRRFSPIWQRHCVHRAAITLIILRIGARLWRCCCIGSKLSPLVANSRVVIVLLRRFLLVTPVPIFDIYAVRPSGCTLSLMFSDNICAPTFCGSIVVDRMCNRCLCTTNCYADSKCSKKASSIVC